MKDSFDLSGWVKLKLVDADGNIIHKDEFHNLIVQTGKNYVIQRITSNSDALISHMALGSSAATAAITNTMLGNEIGRVAVTTTTVFNVIKYNTIFNPGVCTGTIREAGMFNSGTVNTGTMLNRTVFAPFSKNATDTLYVEWQITLK